MRCAEWLQHRDINVGPAPVSRGVNVVAHEIRVHPVRDYLTSLVWDNEPRLDQWLIKYLGAEDTPLNRAIGSRWMISAIARIMQPGAKVDPMLILEGPQGAKKSSALKTLAGADWFTDELAGRNRQQGCRAADARKVGHRDRRACARARDAIGRAEVSRIKAFLTRTADRYRPPYERYVVEVPRQCVFAGSVNPDTYLRDETGNRRFWPVRCGTIDLGSLQRDRDQLWAEAVLRHGQGAIWWFDEPDLITLVEVQQNQRYQAGAWDGRRAQQYSRARPARRRP